MCVVSLASLNITSLEDLLFISCLFYCCLCLWLLCINYYDNFVITSSYLYGQTHLFYNNPVLYCVQSACAIMCASYDVTVDAADLLKVADRVFVNFFLHLINSLRVRPPPPCMK